MNSQMGARAFPLDETKPMEQVDLRLIQAQLLLHLGDEEQARRSAAAAAAPAALPLPLLGLSKGGARRHGEGQRAHHYRPKHLSSNHCMVAPVVIVWNSVLDPG